ncbi:MAG: NUDIX domain-containing protein [Alphaproteobacteria bacterium]|nr:MAG: NUDIX domain-containing protein [Alphaproteobacteria bacterium]
MSDDTADVPIRDAATVIALRDIDGVPHVLMGQRGHKAAFMPSKFVFPGGALDAGDARVQLAEPLDARSRERLAFRADPAKAQALAAAAIRELWEEAGLALGIPGPAPEDAPEDWRSFLATGLVPSAAGLKFIFRAVTPPGRPRRFDARFFLVDAARIAGDVDDFSRATDELSHMQWIALHRARELDLPFITEVVLAEVEQRLEDPAADPPVPFFWHEEGRSHFLRID